MTAKEVTEYFAKMKREDPETFYRALGTEAKGVDILDPFFGGSYELGIIAGALYALEHFTK